MFDVLLCLGGWGCGLLRGLVVGVWGGGRFMCGCEVVGVCVCVCVCVCSTCVLVVCGGPGALWTAALLQEESCSFDHEEALAEAETQRERWRREIFHHHHHHHHHHPSPP